MRLIWEEFLNILKQEVGSHVVETWFKAVVLEQWDQKSQTVYLVMPNGFVSNWIQEHYLTLIKTHLSRLLQVETLKVVCAGKNNSTNSSTPLIQPASLYSEQKNVSQTSHHLTQNSKASSSQSTVSLVPLTRRHYKAELLKLNAQYTFNSFVVGPTNELAHAAAIAVSQNLGKVYNPLFIYGGTGLGKTHLLHAIGNEITKKNPQATIFYETSDSFINEFVNAIRLDKTRQFRDKYQKVDLLLLDDIQFFSHKEQTQETFFHIFDSLFGQHKQVVFSSDTLPHHILGLQNRLQSRLQSGLVADVQMPTVEMKMAIVKKKALLHNLTFDDNVARFIAEFPTSSIRELEGHLIRLSAFSSLANEPITVEMAKKVLICTKSSKQRLLSLEEVLKAVSKCCHVSIADLRSKKRTKSIVLGRQIAFYVMKKCTPHSLQIIGQFMGGKDHTTVLHAISKIEHLIQKNREIGITIETIQKTFAH